MLHKSLAALAAIAAILGVAAPALSDGKLYMRERVPPGVPYQRAIIMYDAGKQTMVLQTAFIPRDAFAGGSASAFAPRGTAAAVHSSKPMGDGGAMHDGARHAADAPLGWVVPLPSVPELSSLDAGQATHVFRIVDRVTGPRVTRISEALVTAAVFALLAALFGYLITVITTPFVPSVRAFVARRIPPRRALPFLIILVVLMVFMLPALGSERGLSGIEVLKSEEIGVFDAKVVKATGSDDLVAWLNEHGFEFTPGDRPVLDDYIRDDWCFVVALVRDEDRRHVQNNVDRLIDPLVMRFDAATPVYPLALTATAGSDTEIVLYLLSDVRRECGGALATRCARPMDDSLESWLRQLLLALDPYADPLPQRFRWLAKFKGTMTPAEMRHDLTFTPSADTKPYREHVVRW